ncbi:Vps51/Vps67-domain-containing protein [Xylariaceae sp. FL0804]|nr:Vps51/Vps67-domain-containing protein [Xylariaceae sp. FL0804]
MSTIASPREPGAPLPRRMNSLTTPTSSTRPSLDVSRSPGSSSSPNPNSANDALSSASSSAAPPKRNRAALREYYNLRKGGGGSASATATPPPPPPQVEVTDPEGETGPHEYSSEVPPSEMDRADFDADAFVRRALAESGMEELLRLYARVLGETRALDAEKKALVYDNYSKLISATETIRKMRTNMDPLNPMASTLDPAIAQIYSQASAIRESLRKSIPPPDKSRHAAEQAAQRKAHTRKLALHVLDTPDKMRELIAEGRSEDARQAWLRPRKLLLLWKEKGLGGTDVDECIADGDAALRGEPSKGNWRDTNDASDEQ